MRANRIISLTCSECLKCKGSHLLVRCPRHTASTKRKGCLARPCKEFLPSKIKDPHICSSVSPIQMCQQDVINTIDDSTGFSTMYKRICYWHPRPQHLSFRIKCSPLLGSPLHILAGLSAASRATKLDKQNFQDVTRVSTVLPGLGSSPDYPCDSTTLHQCRSKPSQLLAYCTAHWKSFTRWQHFREGQTLPESFVKKAEQIQFSISTRAKTRGTVSAQGWGGFMTRNRQPKPSLSMHEISPCDQIQANHKKDIIMNGSTDLAPCGMKNHLSKLYKC